jgi:DNA-binding MarR family transcriptional regulator
MCGSLRRAARALTQMYEKELRPLGLRSTQHTILQVLSRAGELRQRKLGEILAMDSTSLTRTLAVMVREGWITERRGQDRRERWIRMSRAGQKMLNDALPAWEKVQSRLRREIGPQSWKNLMQLTHQLTHVAATEGDPQ